ncbi:DNA repair protein RecN [Carboxydothermus ferrireducens]|uniref:DNA repair protein RecN n=1 Tax=Carboxydothermus ferrireducens DSM 11255 TaxID=1119529 RepID=A0ABX2RF76_9THEO|nr:DNA repair protein RecN [Carboxydothermus ferrireducens]NYE58693.1 DNA repair protein RecN (Recombination protein N) [Carboxydothermus ferrireducens DSM 11255]
MLLALTVENFGLIERVNMEFTPGLNVLTGETGAGKSMLIDALLLLLGQKARGDMVRKGTGKALLTATFESEKLCRKLREYGLPADEVNIFSREIAADGKSVARINGTVVPLTLYREVTLGLIDVMTQHEQQMLLAPSYHLKLLDRTGNEEFQRWCKQLKEAYEAWVEAEKQYEEITSQEMERLKRIDYLKFCINEIEKINPSFEEEEQLKLLHNRLLNQEKLYGLIGNAYREIYGENEPGIVDRLGRIIKDLKEAARFDAFTEEISKKVEEATLLLEEAALDLKTYLDDMENQSVNPDEVEERLYRYELLKKKYGPTLKDVLNFLEKARQEYQNLSEIEENKAFYQEKAVKLRENYYKINSLVKEYRRKLAVKLEESIAQHLRELLMPHAQIKVVFTDASPGPRGDEAIQFYFLPNPGEDLKPLARIASGGELSRLLLSFKLYFNQVDEHETLIFDEIESGLGGSIIEVVGEKLKKLSSNHQVLLVTHSPIIAGFADTHFVVEKVVSEERTETRVKKLTFEERKWEIARMLGEKEIEALNLEMAEKILKKGK